MILFVVQETEEVQDEDEWDEEAKDDIFGESTPQNMEQPLIPVKDESESEEKEEFKEECKEEKAEIIHPDVLDDPSEPESTAEEKKMNHQPVTEQAKADGADKTEKQDEKMKIEKVENERTTDEGHKNKGKGEKTLKRSASTLVALRR